MDILPSFSLDTVAGNEENIQISIKQTAIRI